MSQQQELKFAELHVEPAETAYHGYQGPVYNDYATDVYEQEQYSAKLEARPDLFVGVNPTFMMQMRLGLIITSLILWVLCFFGGIWVVIHTAGPLAFVTYPMVFLGLVIFTGLVVMGNILFNRRR